MSDSPGHDIEQLSSYRSMFERGELSKEEYDRIKAREAQRLRDKVAPRTTANGAPAPKELPANPSPPSQDPMPPQL